MDPGRIREIAEEAKLRGIALECNTGCHWRYAHPDFGLSDLWLILLAEDDGRRKVYRITAAGREALTREYARLKAMVADGRQIEEDGDGQA